ncbi:hypothetical protein MMC30_002955 [Trapelia coarctata]|nr:hypothetical protein [Trapelia coarctata]
MRVSTVAILYGAQLAAAVTTMKACAQDNCLRAVIASAFPTRKGTTDCSSYFATTVTPATVSLTETDAPTVTTIILQKRADPVFEPHPPSLGYIRAAVPTVAKRQMTVVPSSIPAYASACSGAVRYSSACSCVGVTGTTITAVAPTTIATITVTAITTLPPVTTTVATVIAGPASSTVVQCQNPLPTFVIQEILPNNPGNQLFGRISLANTENSNVGFVTADQSQASRFSLNAQGNLVQGNFLANIDAGQSFETLYFNSAGAIASNGFQTAVCSIDGAGTLTCNDNGNTILQLCSQNLYIGNTLQAGCVAPTFKAIPLCAPPTPN